MAATETGHHSGRCYLDQDGAFHINSGAFYNSDGNDIADQLDVLDTLVAAELTYIDGSIAGTVVASKALVVDGSRDIGTLGDVTTDGWMVIGGTQANTSGSAIAITSSQTGCVQVYSDDGGSNIGASVRGLRSRFLLTTDASGSSIRALQGQLKMADLTDVTTGIYTALQGYVEMAGTHVSQTGATFSCIDASMEITTALTVNSGGEACGLHVETTGSGTITNNGTCAGILIQNASGAADWPVGLYINSASIATNGIYMPGGTAIVAVKLGTLSSTTAGSGLTLTDSVTRALEVHADDNDTARSTGTQGRAIFGRTMIYANSACEDWGIHGLSKMSAVAKTANVSAGVVGAFETTGVCSTATGSGNTFCTGVMGRVGTGGTFTIGSGTFVSCVMAFGNNPNANAFTNSGYCGFLATLTDVGTAELFDYGLYIDTGSAINGIYLGATTQACEMVVSALPADARGARYAFTCATPAMSDGYGAFEIDLTVSGVATGLTSAASTWINVPSGGTIPASSYAWVHNDGIWLDNSATTTNSVLVWARVQFIFGTNTGYANLHLFDLNLDIDQNMTSLINVNNLALTGFTSGAHSSAVTGSIPFIGTGGSVKYIRVYDSAS